MSGKEGGENSSRSILGQFQTVIGFDQNGILKWRFHYNFHTVIYSYIKYGNNIGMQRGPFRCLKMRHSVVGYIAHSVEALRPFFPNLEKRGGDPYRGRWMLYSNLWCLHPSIINNMSLKYIAYMFDILKQEIATFK